MAPMLLRLKISRRTRSTEKFVEACRSTRSSFVWMFTAPIEYFPARPASRPPARIGTGCPLSSMPMRRLKNGKGREEQTEPRQIHLLLVVFDLREVGVVCKVGDQPLGHAELRVHPGVAGRFIHEGRVGRHVGLHRRDAVRLHFEQPRNRRGRNADERCRGRKLE
jgi:hypothetical protein